MVHHVNLLVAVLLPWLAVAGRSRGLLKCLNCFQPEQDTAVPSKNASFLEYRPSLPSDKWKKSKKLPGAAYFVAVDSEARKGKVGINDTRRYRSL